MTFSKSALDEAARRWSLTSPPIRVNALLLGIRSVVLAVFFNLSAREVEKTAARNEESSSFGNAV